MRPEEQDLAYVWDMLEATKNVAQIMAGRSKDDWKGNLMLRMAVERGVEVVGEVARHVSKTYQKQHPEIPWRQIIGQRNILAHEYGQIDHDRLFETATRDIPRLIELLSLLLPPVEES